MLTIIGVVVTVGLLAVSWLMVGRYLLVAITFRTCPDKGEFYLRLMGIIAVAAINIVITRFVLSNIVSGNSSYSVVKAFAVIIEWTILLLISFFIADRIVTLDFSVPGRITGWVMSLSGRVFVNGSEVGRTWVDRLLGIKYFYSGFKIYRYGRKGRDGRQLDVTLVVKATDRTNPSDFMSATWETSVAFEKLIESLMANVVDQDEIVRSFQGFRPSYEDLEIGIQKVNLYPPPIKLMNVV